MLQKDIPIAPVCEGLLILVLALAAWIAHSPLIFASLGPTAYELVETPERGTSRPYNIIVGHLIAVVLGFFALFVTGAIHVPPLTQAGMPLARVWCAALAAALTVLGTLLARATQPAATATALLIALGYMQHWRDAFIIMAAVVFITLLGEPIRRWRLAARQQQS